MANWINEVDRIDKMLAAAGVPDTCRLRAVSKIADVLAQADKASREAGCQHALERRAAILCKEHGATRAAEIMGKPVRTVYWLRDRHYRHASTNCATAGVLILQESA